MSKEVQMSIKMKSELRDQFMAASRIAHRPAAQVIRELMRTYIARQEMPNAESIAAIEAADRGEVTSHSSTDALYKSLGI